SLKDGASWSPTCPRAGHKSFSPAVHLLSMTARRHGRPSCWDILPCRRKLRPSRFEPLSLCRVPTQTAAPPPSARNRDTAAIPIPSPAHREQQWRSSLEARCKGAPARLYDRFLRQSNLLLAIFLRDRRFQRDRI